MMSCNDPSVRIVTKSPKVGPLLIFSISLITQYTQVAGELGFIVYDVRTDPRKYSYAFKGRR